MTTKTQVFTTNTNETRRKLSQLARDINKIRKELNDEIVALKSRVTALGG